MSTKTLRVIDCGKLDYLQAFDFQRDLQQKISRELCPDTLLLLEHPNVYTVGRSESASHILLPKEQLEKLGAQVIETNRGGKVTYHGPGQIVGYTLFDLRRYGRDVPGFVENIEEAIIQTLSVYGIHGGRNPEYTGVWVGDNKICAIGIAISRWVTMHGFALNVNTDLSYFRHINPCGITDKGVTSMELELGMRIEMTEVQDLLREKFAQVFGFTEIEYQKGMSANG
ncbi:MAG: lipoyl(octanoyl) transferase LipB [Firmicutes bacterium]|nr:lipoyl(octanoyl) transferase LipB [Bacillota bacterium]